jgi:hypothetical protein
MKTIFTKGYYCLHVILFGPTLIIWLQFDVIPTTEIYVISSIFLREIRLQLKAVLNVLWKWTLQQTDTTT